jgi:drug/metabolite transporter (DMT)-like permease
LFFVPFFGKTDLSAFLDFKNLLVFTTMMFLALGWNLLYYKSIKEEKVQEFELFLMLNPLLVSLLATAVFPAERNIHIFVASIVASLALIFAHFKRRHISFSKNHLRVLFCVVLMSLEVIFNKLVLGFTSPVFLYFIRCFILFFMFLAIYKPKFSQVKSRGWFLLFINGLFAVGQMIFKFYGFQKIGIMTTNLIMTFSPVLVYISSVLIFKERLQKRLILAGTIILICIVYAIMAR